jgi:tRNA isopentenyl-2-thiomethyl-A-37 hydroxylase MiaE
VTRRLGKRLSRARFGRQVHDLVRPKQSKHSIAVGGMGDIAGEQLHGWRQIDRSVQAMHLRVQNIHHSDFVAGLHETARKRGPDESSTTGNEHGR